MRSWRRRVAGLVGLLVAAAAQAQAQWIYVLHDDGSIGVVNPATRSVERSIRLTHPNPDTLYPTPGGKYVLVTHRDSAVVSAVDVEQHAQTSSYELPTRAATLTFSPMGDTVLTTQAGTGRVDIWSHSRSRLEPVMSVTAGVAGSPALFNRRATRMYRSTGDGLAFVYLKTGETIGQVQVTGGPMAWVFTPDYRSLWGASLVGDAVAVVDEARTRLVEVLSLPHRAHEPVLSPDGGRAWLIDAAGSALVALDTRTRKVAARVDLPTAVTGIAAGGATEIWASDPTGRLYLVDTRRMAVIATAALSGPTRQMSYITLRKGEGYACF